MNKFELSNKDSKFDYTHIYIYIYIWQCLLTDMKPEILVADAVVAITCGYMLAFGYKFVSELCLFT